MQKSSFFFFLPHHHNFCYDILVIPMQKSSTSEVYLCPSEKRGLWLSAVGLWLTKSCGKAVEKLWKSCRKAVEKLWKSFYILAYNPPEQFSLYPIHMSLSHFIPWTKLAVVGGGFRACFFMGCNSKEIGRETVKKKPPELH